MSQYKLYYFDLRARVEPIRLTFVYAGVPFEDIRLGMEEFKRLKPILPNGQIPLLEVDGHKISQSGTILRFLAKQFNLAGRDHWEEAKADEIFSVFYDRIQEQLPYILHRLGNPNYKNGDQLYSEKYVPASRLALDYYSRLLNNGQEFILRSKPSYIDFVVAEHIETMNEWFAESVKKYPQLVEYKKRVYGLPKVAKYIQGRPKTMC